MKITMRDLDENILEKLKSLDGVVNSYDEKNPDGFVSYGPNGFYFKKTNDTFLKKIYTEDEIVDLEECLETPKKNILSSSFTDFRIDKKFNKAVQKFLYRLTPSLVEFENRIVKIENDEKVMILLDNGVLTTEDKSLNINVLELLHSNFNLTAQLDVGHIVRILTYKDTDLIVATTDFGIYKISLNDNSVELLVSQKGVKDIALTYTGNLFVAAKDSCAQYDIASSLKTEKYLNIFNDQQLPEKIIKTNEEIFVQATPAGCYSTENLIHLWKLDGAKVAYNCKDRILEKLPTDKDYQILFDSKTQEAVFFAGKINSKIFVWKIALDGKYTFTEEIIDCIDSTQFTGFMAFNGLLLFIVGKHFYIVKDNTIINKYQLPEVSNGLYMNNNQLFTVAKSGLVKIDLPKFEEKSEMLSYRIYSDVDACNNIDIFVKGGSRNERISLIDEDTNKEIKPSYYFLHGKDSVIKLMNCKATKIKMLVSVTTTSNIDGIVVKNNRMFLR